jgi:hypothetical protein
MADRFFGFHRPGNWPRKSHATTFCIVIVSQIFLARKDLLVVRPRLAQGLLERKENVSNRPAGGRQGAEPVAGSGPGESKSLRERLMPGGGAQGLGFPGVALLRGREMRVLARGGNFSPHLGRKTNHLVAGGLSV